VVLLRQLKSLRSQLVALLDFLIDFALLGVLGGLDLAQPLLVPFGESAVSYETSATTAEPWHQHTMSISSSSSARWKLSIAPGIEACNPACMCPIVFGPFWLAARSAFPVSMSCKHRFNIKTGFRKGGATHDAIDHALQGS
jgi:hypothetical protein